MAQPATTPRPDPNEKLVRVFEAEEETEALVVKGLLDAASIDNDLAPLSLTQYAFPNVGGTIILVREEDAERARRLISEHRQNQLSADDETQEIDISDSAGKPPAKA
jgi:Putative prokaryotic signal transducing protein